MKIRVNANIENNQIKIIPSHMQMLDIFKKKLSDKKVTEIHVTFETIKKNRTNLQNRTMWELITIIFESQNGYKPNEDEKYNLYLDIIDAYGMKVKNQFTNNLRPIHISEADTEAAAKIINACINILAEQMDLSLEQQLTINNIMKEYRLWEQFNLIDLSEFKLNEEWLTVEQWHYIHKNSFASGKSPIELCHIISRGADCRFKDMPWNWLALTHEEHMLQHEKGWNELLKLYPHLRYRIVLAKKLASQEKE